MKPAQAEPEQAPHTLKNTTGRTLLAWDRERRIYRLIEPGKTASFPMALGGFRPA